MKNVLRTIGVFLLITALVISLIPTSGVEASSTSDFEIKGNKLVKYSGTDEIVSIPDGVLTIGQEAFAGNNYVVKVNIGGNVKDIEYGAFADCNSLRTVTMGDRVESVGQAAFANDKSLQNLNFGASVKNVGSGVFAGDTNLTNFALSDANVHLMLIDDVLYDSKLEKLICMLPTYKNGIYEMPLSVTEVLGYAFWGNSNIKNVSVSSNLESVPEYAFSNCSNLRQVKIPLVVHSIDAKAFEDCVNLSFVDCPDSMEFIHESAFDGCPKVTISARAGSYADQFARNLKKSEVAEVEYEETYKSAVVTKETVSATLPVSGDEMGFEVVEGSPENSDKTQLSQNMEPYIAARYASGVINGADVIPHTIYDPTTDPDTSLLGASTIVGGRAMVFIDTKPYVRNADADKNIVSSTDNGLGTNKNNAKIDLSESEGSTKVLDEDGNEVEVKSLGNIVADNAQKGKHFPKFTIVNDRIASQAYYQDQDIEEYDIPEDITLIGDFAFSRSNLKSIDIPEGVTKIGYGAFYHCNDLADVKIPSTVTSIGEYAFSETAFLKNSNDEFVILGDGVLIAYNGSDSVVTIPEGVKLIADGTFKDHQGITAVNLANTVTIIGEEAFSGCTNLKTLNRGEKVSSIGANAFKNTALTNVSILPSVTSIGLGAFDLNNGTDTVTFLGNTLPTLTDGFLSSRLPNEEARDYAFGNIKTAIVPANITNLSGTILEPGKYGFKGIVYDTFGNVVSDNSIGVYEAENPGISIDINSALFTKDGNSKAEITGDEGSYILHITDSQNAAEKISIAYGDLYGGRTPENLKGFDISLRDSSDTINISRLGKQSVDVTLPLPAGINTNDLHMVSLDADGQLEAVEFSLSDSESGQKYINFKCEHFSPYGLYNYEGTNAAVEKGGEHIKDDTPDTGDNMIHPKWFLVIGLIALAIALLFISKSGKFITTVVVIISLSNIINIGLSDVNAYAAEIYGRYEEVKELTSSTSTIPSKTEESVESINVNGYLILGDSRCCSLIVALDKDHSYSKIYRYDDDAIHDAIYVKDKNVIVICAEGGGFYENGAYQRSWNRMQQLLRNNEYIMACTQYKAYNLYGVNDIIFEGMKAMRCPVKYISRDEAIKRYLGKKCVAFYQFNAGPVNEKGWMCADGTLNNGLINQYNSHFYETRNIKVIDLFQYLCDNGFDSMEDINGNSGIHYDSNTDNKILRLIFSL